MAKTLVCTQCGYVGKAKTAVKGNGAIEIVLWLCFLIPGIIYSLWRSGSRHKVCPQCKGDILIPADAPRARKVMEENGVSPDEYIEKAKQETAREKRNLKAMLVITGLIVTGVVALFMAVV